MQKINNFLAHCTCAIYILQMSRVFLKQIFFLEFELHFSMRLRTRSMISQKLHRCIILHGRGLSTYIASKAGRPKCVSYR